MLIVEHQYLLTPQVFCLAFYLKLALRIEAMVPLENH